MCLLTNVGWKLNRMNCIELRMLRWPESKLWFTEHFVTRFDCRLWNNLSLFEVILRKYYLIIPSLFPYHFILLFLKLIWPLTDKQVNQTRQRLLEVWQNSTEALSVAEQGVGNVSHAESSLNVSRHLLDLINKLLMEEGSKALNESFSNANSTDANNKRMGDILEEVKLAFLSFFPITFSSNSSYLLVLPFHSSLLSHFFLIHSLYFQ